MQPDPKTNIDGLLEHASWARALARKLVRDAHLADDLVQRAWVAALLHPPAPGTPEKRWLARVLRNSARDERRAQARRHERESDVARSERDAGRTQEIGLQEELLQALRRLDAPLREAIWLRYYDGLAPRAIAKQLGVPAKAIHKRLTNALERLRAELDRTRGGDRRAWVAAFAPLARSFQPAPWIALTTTQFKLAAALVVGAALVLGWTTWSRSAQPETTLASVERGEFGLAERALAVPEGDAERQLGAPTTETPPGPAANETALVQTATIRGRFVLGSGQAVAGVEVKLAGSTFDDQRAAQHGLPSDWNDLARTSDAEGRFAVQFIPPAAYGFTLRATHARLATMHFAWGAIAPGESIDLGEVVLQPSGTVRGKIVDTRGRPAHGRWEITARPPMHYYTAGGRRSAVLSTTYDPAQEEFEITELEPGPISLEARSELGHHVYLRDCQVLPGEITRVELVEELGAAQRLAVRAWVEAYPFFPADSWNVSLTASKAATGRAPDFRNDTYLRYEDLGDDRYTLEITGEHIRPFVQTGIQRGTRVDARVHGNVQVQLTVVDAESGSALDDYELMVGLNELDAVQPVFLAGKHKPPPPDGVYRDILPWPQTWRVRAGGYATQHVELGNMQPRETRELVVRLDRGSRVHGSVRTTGGYPAWAGTRVFLLPRDDDRPNAWRGNEDVFGERQELALGADASFSFERVPAGTFTLRARGAPMIETDVRLVVQRGIDPEPVELVLPALAVFEGRLSWPAGKAVSGVSLMFEALLSEPEQTKFQTFNPLEIPVRDDGTFGAGLPECTGRVALRLPRFTLPRGPYSASSNNGPERVLDLVTLEASTPTRRDFDMSAHVPTRFAVEATVAGRVVPSLVVEARATFDATGPLAGCAVDFEGRGVSSALFPGEYCIVVRSASGSWRYALPGKLRLEPDHVPELKIDVPLVAGSLRVIWTENQLPVTQTVYIDHVAPHFEVAFATPDARGDLKLELAPGTYILRRGESRAPFEWSESGPQRSEIRLRK